MNIIPLQDIERMAVAIAKSGLFGMKTPEQALALMLVAQAEGQHPATITQDYDIIQGRAVRKTHSVLARFQAMGGRVEWHRLDDEVADATFSHPQGGSLRLKWTIDQARRAGLAGKDNWKNYPRAMLRARCIAEGVRAVYPAALGGMLIAEEAMDLPAEAKVIEPEQGAGDAPIPAPRSKSKAEAPAPEALATPSSPKPQEEPVDGNGPTISDGALRILLKKLESAGIERAEFCAAFGIEKVEALPMARVNEAYAWLTPSRARSQSSDGAYLQP
ncbi:MAG: hypothetical protein KatS3mg082_1765 [Nitrospiraceae bacterium]|nr:MAG: hypothetical protein KatS3mg082_1765 [Nitrospiraceae bacterium]